MEVQNWERFELEKGELRYDKEKDILYVGFNDIEKGKWIELVVENLKGELLLILMRSFPLQRVQPHSPRA